MPTSPYLVTLSLAIGLAALATGVLSRSGLPAEEAFGTAQEAIAEGDAGRALSLLEEAANAGHLGALEQLADGRERGYLTTAGPNRSASRARVAVWSWPGQATRARHAYRRVLADSARAGHPQAMLLVAQDLLGGGWAWSEAPAADLPPATRDSAEVLYARLRSTSAPRLSLSFLARALGHDDDARALRQAAVDGGEPQACWFQIVTETDVDLSTPAGVAAYVDSAEACRASGPPPETDYAADAVRELADQAAAGNRAAVDFIDALRAEGVFERHPRLVDVVDPS